MSLKDWEDRETRQELGLGLENMWTNGGLHARGDYLREKYEGATEVKVSRRGKLRLSNPNYSLPTAQDLVYLEESPNYCIRNISLGAPGTMGRECNRTSAGVDGCALMCCGRGYNTKKIVVKERCECKFHWCCRVDCNTCVKTLEVYTCK
ncbi:jg25167 [Pararge aegeria aegeria]|uniref:Protein Wnt n=1 Tax=Pararge aegeria aegeria TaxID=348720 RepID=A0A8S4RVK9_9NEOP|nr:jg25167 [Pararge aegeria aegeria]